MNPYLVDQSTVKIDNALLFPWLSSGLDEKQTNYDRIAKFISQARKTEYVFKNFLKDFFVFLSVCADN